MAQNELYKLFVTVGAQGIDSVEKDINGLTKTVSGSQSKLTSAFKKIGTAVAAAFAVDKIISFGKEIVNAAAEVAAEESAFSQIMGDYADEATEKLGQIADATGMVDSRLTPYMTSMTAKFKGLGFGVEEATDYSVRGLTLAADAAAFWDKSLDESMSHLNSFINGSYEGGEAIGLFANDTQMAMYAVEQGIVSSTKEWASLDEATKQATRLEYAEKMMKLSGATGQAAKEADQYANVQANLTEKWRQFKAQIGQPVLQRIVIPAMKILCDVIDAASSAFDACTKFVKDHHEEIQTFKGILVGATTAVGTFLLIMNWGQIMSAAAAALGLVRNAFLKLNQAIASNPIGAVMSLIAGLIAWLVYLYQTNDEFRAFVDATLAQIWAKLQQVFAWIQENVIPVLQQVIAWIQTNVLPVIQSFIAWIGENVIPVIQAVISWISETLGAFWAWFMGLFTSGEAEGAIGGFWEKIKGFFSSAWEFIKNVWAACLPFFQSIWDGFLEPLWGLAQEIWGAFKYAWDCIVLVWDYVKPYFAGIWAAIKAIFSVVGQVLGMHFKNAWEIIKLCWGVAVEFFKLIWAGIKSAFSVVSAVLGGFFKTAWAVIKGVWQTAIAFFTMIWAGIKAVFAVVKGVLSGNFSDAWAAIKNVWDKVKNYFSVLWSSIKNIFGSVGSWFGNTFRAAWNAVKNVFSAWGSFFSGLWTKIKNTFSNIGTNIANAIGGAVKSGLNGVISAIEGIINSGINLINGAINLINKIPGVEIGKIGTLKLARFAKGGVVDEPTPALFGEDGAEAVVPLERNTGWIKKVATQMHEFTINKGTADDALIRQLIAVIEEKLGERLANVELSIEALIEMLGMYFPEALKAARRQMVLDTGVLVGELADPMNEELGKIAAKKDRGR